MLHFGNPRLAVVRLYVRLEACQKLRCHTCALNFGFVWRIDGTYVHYAPPGVDREVLEKDGVTYGHTLHLHSIGLLAVPETGSSGFFVGSGVHLTLEPGAHRLCYHDKSFEAISPSASEGEPGGCALSAVPLTRIGDELVPIAGGKPSAAYVAFCLKALGQSLELRETTNEQKAGAGDAAP